jgi:aryl-alcohol dehydrogenase-like predicted oxidoreductase
MIGIDELGRIVFGCGNFGGMGSSPTLRHQGDDRDRAFILLDQARSLGLTRFDTANTYGGGASETILGEWLRSQDGAWRAGLQIATKVGNPHGCPPGDRPLSREQVLSHLERSLERLGVERIDLYYLHEFDPHTPLEETLDALDRALRQGKIASFGVSNATIDDLRAVLSLIGESTLRAAFTHIQNQFNLLEQRDLADVIPLAQAEGLSYVAFSPLAGGLLSGKYRADQAPAAGTRLNAAPEYYESQTTPAAFAAIERLAQKAAAEGQTVAAAALRFILDTAGVDSLIIAPRSVDQFGAYAIGKGGASGPG